MKEFWKDIEGYEGLYQISSLGRVKSFISNKGTKTIIMKIQHTYDGYERVGLTKNGKQTIYPIHRLVANAFISNPDNLPQINHKDENKTNNAVCNLEWCTNKYNVNYGERNRLASEGISKAIVQYTLTGEYVRDWKSITEAANTLNYDLSSIAKCCRGKKKTHHGFIWEYAV